MPTYLSFFRLLLESTYRLTPATAPAASSSDELRSSSTFSYESDVWQGEADEESPVPDDGLEGILGFNSSSLPGLEGPDFLVGRLSGLTCSKESDDEDGDLESLSCLLLEVSGSTISPDKAVSYEPEVWQGDEEVVSVPNRFEGLVGFDSASPS